MALQVWKWLLRLFLMLVAVGIALLVWLWAGAQLDDVSELLPPLASPPPLAIADNGFEILARMDVEDFSYFEPSDSHEELIGLLASDWNMALAERYLQRYGHRIDEVRAVVATARYQTPPFDVERFPAFQHHMSHLRLTMVSSRINAEQGDTDAAVDDAVLALRFVQKLKSDEAATLLSYMIALAAQHEALNWTHRLASNYALSSEQLLRAQNALSMFSPFPSDNFHTVFAGESRFLEQSNRAVQDRTLVERIDYLRSQDWHWFNGMATDSDWPLAIIATLNPAYLVHFNNLTQESRAFFREQQRLSLRGCLEIKQDESFEVPVRSWKVYLPNGLGREWQQWRASYGEYFLRRCFGEFHLQATRTALALMRYQRDSGALPRSLDALVPSYLEQLPQDPFNSQPLDYDPASAWLRSVGTGGAGCSNDAGFYIRHCHEDAACRGGPIVPVHIEVGNPMRADSL